MLDDYTITPISQDQRYILRELVDRGYITLERYATDCREDGHDADGGINWTSDVLHYQIRKLRCKLRKEFIIRTWRGEGYWFDQG